MAGAPVPNYVVAPPRANVAYTVATVRDWNSVPVVNFAPGLAVSKGTIVMQPLTGATLPGHGYHTALRDVVLGATPPEFFHSDETFHFSLGPS